MFSELPKLFDKNFALGFYLPVVIFLTANIILFQPIISVGNVLISLPLTDILILTTLLGIVSWILGVFLLVTNREIIRVLEGYGTLNPVRFFYFLEKFKYYRLNNRLSKIAEEYYKLEDANEDIPEKLIDNQRKILIKLSEEFPNKGDWLMPTPFGNVIKAFETYPGEMYGIEAIQGWNRISPLIPDTHYQEINSAKSLVDYWVNLGMLFFIFFIETRILLIIFPMHRWILYVSLFALFITWISAYRATSAAIQWGDTVKSSFDLYRYDLAEKLGITIIDNRVKEKETWISFSQAIVFRMPDKLPERTTTKNKVNKQKS